MQSAELLVKKVMEVCAPAWQVLLQEFVARQLLSGFLPIVFGAIALGGVVVCLHLAMRALSAQQHDDASWYVFFAVMLYWLGLVLCACGATMLVDAYFAPNLQLLLQLL